MTYGEDDERAQLEAALSIGAAAEYLGRAVVAFHDPLLLAKPGSIDSQIMLSRANTSGALDHAILRTVDSASVWKMLETLRPTFAPHMKNRDKEKLPSLVNRVMWNRNAAAHMALVEQTDLEDAVRALVTIVESLHPLGSSSENDFWPADLMPTVALLKDKNSKAAALSFEAKLASAKARVANLLSGMSTSEAERFQRALEARDISSLVLDRHRDVYQSCPACGRGGTAVYLVLEGDPKSEGYEETRGGSYVDYGWSRPLNFYALTFRCPVCGLDLEPEEFSFAAIPIELDEDYEATDDPYEDWEPDEDYLRGR
ncbi:hypothetical protein ASF79_09545 [Agreia sp. Leaf335]|uniref:hypothetical protein n=1 Tax=Agreia sp. Leaf335 TaxID=1736340 RepID=UPI000700F911|nr:hypothetical protein [Agreia sp. Leaf335]KQR22467.1 hypothetical protein ASF79_09545 [Agreia sp. Leaf335]